MNKNILIGKSSQNNFNFNILKSENWALCRLRTSKFNNTKSVAVVLISISGWRIKGYDNKLLNSFRYCLAHFSLACIYYFMLNINKRMCSSQAEHSMCGWGSLCLKNIYSGVLRERWTKKIMHSRIISPKKRLLISCCNSLLFPDSMCLP